jgi:two-component system chemotaxis response regulator CheB
VINVLIVDDSALVRDILRDFFDGDTNFNIIGEAADGEEGVQKILSLQPDLVTVDVEMPKMNGLEMIEAVLKKSFVPIVVISSQDTAKIAYEAVLRGALEFYPKDTFAASLEPIKRNAIYETLKRISGVKAKKSAVSAEPLLAKQVEKREIYAVVIASSTGGPKALSRFFTLLPGDFALPIIIVQHNSTGFDESFAQWLATYTPLHVKLAEEMETPRPGTVYIAQTDKHLTIQGSRSEGYYLCSNNDAPENNQKPAADVLFRTAAESLGESIISVVFTGMGSDGALGTRRIKEKGGITLAQDEETSLIYGMPKAAADTGCVDMVLPLDRIAEELVRVTR